MQFEWDKQKNEENKKKHHICFENAIRVFWDYYRIEILDERMDYGEERYVVIGMVENIISVVYTERGEVTRIISARKATEKERKMYYDCKRNN